MTTGTKVDAGNIPCDGGVFSVVVSNLNPATIYYYIAVYQLTGKKRKGQYVHLRHYPDLLVLL